MEVRISPLQDEIATILQEGPKPVHSRWRLEIQLPDGQALYPMKLLSVDIQRNYEENFGDYVLVDALFPLGKYNRRILPNKEKLKATLVRKPTGEREPEPEDVDSAEESRTYRAVLADEHSDVLAASQHSIQSEEGSDLSDLVRAEIQLVDPALEELRLTEVGGIYRNVLGGDVVKHVLSEQSQALDLPEEDSVQGVDMVEPDNSRPQKQIIIPHGTRLMDLPEVIQKDWGGVYSNGIGCYLQEGEWFVWPLYDVERFDQVASTVTFINVPADHYPNVERTFRLKGRQLTVVSTGEVRHEDQSHHRQLNEGSGVRYADANRVFEGMGKTQDNRHTVRRGENTSEFRSVSGAEVSTSPVKEGRVSSNLFHAVSRMSGNQGSTMTLTWEHSDPSLIYPGMPARVLYLNEDEVEELHGVVIGAHHFIHDTRRGIEPGNHVSNSAVTAFFRHHEKE